MKKIIVFCILIVSIMSIYGNTERDVSRVMVQLGSGVTSLDDQPVISIGGSLTYGMTHWLNVGVEGSFFHTLEHSYEDSLGRTYQAESATSEQFLQPYWKVNDVWALGIKLGTGIQLVQFRYEESFRDELVWTEEILDKLVIPSLSASFTVQYSLCPIHALQLEFGYRHIKDTVSQFSDQSPLSGSLFGKLQYGFRW